MTDRSIGLELWNCPESLIRLASDRAGVIDNTVRFLSDYCKIQEEYGKKIRKLATSYSKGQSEDDSTLHLAFSNVVQMILTQGSALETEAKDITSQVLQPLKAVYSSNKKDIETQSSNMHKVYGTLDNNKKMIDVSWTKYFNAFKDKQASAERSERVDADMTSTKLDQLKFKEIANQKAEEYEKVMSRYAEDLGKYNAIKNQTYYKGMVAVLEEVDVKFRNTEEQTQDLLLQMVKLKGGMLDKIQESCGSTSSALSAIDPAKDVTLMLTKLSTGKLPPIDLPFIRLDNVNPRLLYGHPSSLAAYMLGIDSSQPCSQLPPVGNSGAAAGGKRTDLHLRSPFICDMSLKPISEDDMVITQVADRIHSLTDQLKQATDERGALVRMVEVYEKNPKLGDSRNVKPKEEALTRRVHSIELWLARLKERYAKLGGDEGLAEAQASMNRQNQSWEVTAKGTQQLLPPGDRTSSGVKPNRQTVKSESCDSDNSFDSEPDEPTARQTIRISTRTPATSEYVGMATVKFEYAGNGTNYLAAGVGERFHVVELDTNNVGWTAVVSEDGSRQGFFPTSFLDVTLS